MSLSPRDGSESLWTSQGRITLDEITSKTRSRMAAWSNADPWYGSNQIQAAQSRGTESILNALTARLGGDSQHVERAVGLMMAQQREDGGWDWLDFGLAPWEWKGAEISGTALALIALDGSENGHLEGLESARTFLRAAELNGPSLHEQMTILWAAQHVPDLLPPDRIDGILQRALAAQLRDGGWSSRAFGAQGRRPPTRSDANATAYITFVLRQVPGPDAEAGAQRGLLWLSRSQRKDGSWKGTSLNSQRAFNRELATDMATAYAYAAFHVGR